MGYDIEDGNRMTSDPRNRDCTVCGTAFRPRLSFQKEKDVEGAKKYYCSLSCKAQATFGHQHDPACDVCGEAFKLQFAYQAKKGPEGSVMYICSSDCLGMVAKRSVAAQESKNTVRDPFRIAVLNQKGGTGKTTTSISLAAGLAMKGYEVLLVDADPQGNVGASLGIAGRTSLYHVLIENAPVENAFVPIRDNLHVLPADDSLAAAEIKLAKHPSRANVLKGKLDKFTNYDFVIVDCGPSLSLINQNVLCFADEVLVPVSCDYLALIGVKQVLKTIKNVNRYLQHPLTLSGVLPTQYDQRARICKDALKALQDHFKEKCLPPIRSNTRLKEAPSHKKTIFEHDARSYGAADYMQVVAWAIEKHMMRHGLRPPEQPEVAPAEEVVTTVTQGVRA